LAEGLSILAALPLDNTKGRPDKTESQTIEK